MVLIRSTFIHSTYCFSSSQTINKFLPLTRGGGTIVGLLVELDQLEGGGDNFLASQGLRAQFNGGEKSGSNNDEESVCVAGSLMITIGHRQ